MAGGRKRVAPGTKKTIAAPATTPVRRSRNAAGRAQASRAATKAKGDAAAAAAEKKGSAVKNYLGTDVDKARETATFDKAKSQRDREQSAATKKRIDTAAQTQRVSGRARSRAGDQAKVHGRTDEQKIASKAAGSRNKRLIRDAALAVAPGGAAGAAAAKVGYAKKGLQVAKAGLKTAAKLGKGSIKQGVKKGVGALAQRASKAGVKKIAKQAGTKALAAAKYKAKVTAKSKLNQAAGGKA